MSEQTGFVPCIKLTPAASYVIISVTESRIVRTLQKALRNIVSAAGQKDTLRLVAHYQVTKLSRLPLN